MARKSKLPSKQKKRASTKKCTFCVEKKTVTYSDVEVLNRYLSERGKIIARVRTGVCAKHQRRLTTAVKRARHLALVPFVVRT
jgi:small subunit ribosomal protein S18